MNTILVHHGILGQKHGIRNGPPYPLVAGAHSSAEKKAGWKKSLDHKTIEIGEGSAKKANNIYKSLSREEKKLVTAREEPPEEYTNDLEYASYLGKSFVLSVGKTPVSTLDIWRENDNDAALAMMTRNEKKYRNKGYASKVVEAGMNWLESSGIEKAYWDVRNDNVASRKLAEKYGFENKGEFKEGWLQYEKNFKRN